MVICTRKVKAKLDRYQGYRPIASKEHALTETVDIGDHSQRMARIKW